jgi:Flp pilus assembly protein TadD
VNLDWGPDEKGNTHPGGPFYQGDKHIVLSIRDTFVKTPLKPPEKTNKPPKLLSLIPDKLTSQAAGTAVTWTAEAKDPENDPVLYRFFLNDDPVTKWTKENRWIWTTTEDGLGESQIEVQARDGKHAGPDKYDDNKVTSFIIDAPQSVPQVSTNQSDLAEDWNNKGLALVKQGKYDEAIKCYDEAIRLDPNPAGAWNNKGVALNNLGKYDESIKASDEAIRLAPNDPNIAMAWHNKGRAFVNWGKYDEAIQACDEAIRLNPKYANTWNTKGLAQYKQGKYEEAIQAYDEAIQLAPNDPNIVMAWNNKALALKALGRATEADAAFAKAKELG